MNIVINNGEKVFVSGISGAAALSTHGGRTRLAFWPDQKSPEFKPGFEFAHAGSDWRVLEVRVTANQPSVASLQLVSKDQ